MSSATPNATRFVSTQRMNYDGWNGSIRLTDAEGNPLKGIKVTLTP